MIKKHLTTIFFILLAFQMCFAQKEDKAAFELSKNLSIYHNILKELNLLYVDSLDNKKIINKGIESMLKELDPYTVYINEKGMKAFQTQTTGEYGGIGTIVGKRGDYVIISQVYEGKPADKAGLKAGDKIIALDGKNVKGFELEKVTDIMKGSPNTSFEMTVERPYAKEKIQTFSVKREQIQLDCVPFDTIIDKTIGYFTFTNFTTKAEKRVKETIKKLKKQGATSLIMDLRGNPGGLLDQAVGIVNLFVPKNQTVVTTKGRITQWNRKHQTSKKPLDSEIPIVVLINRGSASASEIVSGSLQDLDRGVVMGTHSFGKGLVQTTREVGYNTRLKVTTSKYYIPSGRCIQALDYTHRNEDGSVGHVPDSLITAFKTKNGRTVYDGGGIMPDVKITSKAFSTLSSQLIRDYQIHDFANWYTNTKNTKDAVFVMNDTIYDDFIAFILKTDFSYKSESYSAFEELKKALKAEDNEAAIDLEMLEKSLKPKLKKDLMKYHKELSDLIEYEISMRLFYQKGAYAQAVRTDTLINEAAKLLQDKARYQGILKGTIAADSSKKQKQEKED